MEAAAAQTLTPTRELATEKASRIVETMRVCVARHGIAGATFDVVAREAGVSRGLLHYYFSTKERLLVEVVRRESDVRIRRIEDAIASAASAADVLDALVALLEDFLGEGPIVPVMFYELMTLAQRNAEIASELAELGRRTRSHMAQALQAKSQSGAIELTADPQDIAGFLFALADGVTVRRLSEPDFDVRPVIGQAVQAARGLIR